MQQHFPLPEESSTNGNINYGRPVIQQQSLQPPIIVNQQIPVVSSLIDPEIFKTTSVVIQCPFCQNVINTNVKKSFNCLSCALCFFSGILFFALIQYCRSKSVACCDAVHICPRCGQKVGEYSSL